MDRNGQATELSETGGHVAGDGLEGDRGCGPHLRSTGPRSGDCPAQRRCQSVHPSGRGAFGCERVATALASYGISDCHFRTATARRGPLLRFLVGDTAKSARVGSETKQTARGIDLAPSALFLAMRWPIAVISSRVSCSA